MKFLRSLFLYNLLKPLLPGFARRLPFIPLVLYLQALKEKLQTRESLDRFTHQHTPHWDYLSCIVPWRSRLWLSRYRGKKWALTWRIKLIAFFAHLGPQTARWLLEEYMITAKADDLPAPDNSWRCVHCGCNNVDTAIFCKDCGEYK